MTNYDPGKVGILSNPTGHHRPSQACCTKTLGNLGVRRGSWRCCFWYRVEQREVQQQWRGGKVAHSGRRWDGNSNLGGGRACSPYRVSFPLYHEPLSILLNL
ncbi:hypothetical protein EUGRSUZ_C00510 [Eucalyptus grandis]|uniref:Uncharacterized protein n=2 Tax=Eucalyptus grandis TaxID=71139 RepID=A0ACC3L9Y0_EUCGR|nr:hypothetical protein EUGRSUZ_C00510 [Eucalyptus grandis]